MCTGGALLSWLWLRRVGGGRLRDVPYGVFSVRLLLCFWNDERRRLTGVGRQPVSLAPRPAACGPARPSAQGRAEVCVSSVRLPALGPRGQRRESPAGGGGRGEAGKAGRPDGQPQPGVVPFTSTRMTRQRVGSLAALRTTCLGPDSAIVTARKALGPCLT